MESSEARPWTPWKRVAVILAVFIGTVGSFVTFRLQRFTSAMQQSIRDFDERTSESRILGKTPEQITAEYGPVGDHFHDTGNEWGNHSRVIAIYGPWGATCRIEFVNDRATKVDHYGK